MLPTHGVVGSVHAAAAHLLPGAVVLAGGVLLFKIWASHSWYYHWKGHRKTTQQREKLTQQLNELQACFDALLAECEQAKARQREELNEQLRELQARFDSILAECEQIKTQQKEPSVPKKC